MAEPKNKAGDADPKSRFVQDGDEGMTINGMSIDEYLKHPDTQAALKKIERDKAAAAAAPAKKLK